MRYLIAICLVVSGTYVAAQQHHPVFPEPERIVYKDGYLPLHKLILYVGKQEESDVVFALQDLDVFIKRTTGKPVKKTITRAAATVSYSIVKTRPSFSSREAYRVSINQQRVQIEAAGTAGLFYAIQTIKQLIAKDNGGYFLPTVEISDQPALQCRGVMMDFAHGGLLKVDEIKRQIDVLALWKANQYYFYNEVSIELKGFEALNYKQCYTQEDIKAIVAYARQRHIDVIPFVAFYGHLHDLLKRENFSDLGIGHYGHELDPRKDTVTGLMRNWIQQYAVLFPSPYIHVGFDETWETHRVAHESDTTIHAETLWLSHLSRINSMLKEYGKTVLAWTDMSHYYPDLLARLPQDILPVVWEYAPDTVALHHYLDPVLQSGHRFFMQPAVSGWGHIYPAAAYTYDNIDLCLNAAIKGKALGMITSVWTDAVEPLVRPSWSFMAYGCAAAWQGHAPNRNLFEHNFATLLFPGAAEELQKACNNLAMAVNDLQECFGKNTSNMPGGTIIESWSNPFDPYYLAISHSKMTVLKRIRKTCEEAEGWLMNALRKTAPGNKDIIESLSVTARLIHYEATRFLWAAVICDRWDQAMLVKKQNNFVFYDIAYLCHGLIQDMMDELGSLRDDYENAWLSESMPYRKNTILGRFTVEYGLWQKLLLKIIDSRVKLSADTIVPRSFTEVFHPDF